MAHNTMYKHLAKHIKQQREHYTGDSTAQALLDNLVNEFSEEMEQRQPGSFVKQTFLAESGTVEVPNDQS